MQYKNISITSLSFYVIIYNCIKLHLRLSYVYYLFVSVALICFVLYLTKIILSKIWLLHCLVLLNSILFKPCLFQCNYHSNIIFICRDQRVTQDVDKLCLSFSNVFAPIIISPFTTSYYLYQAAIR